MGYTRRAFVGAGALLPLAANADTLDDAGRWYRGNVGNRLSQYGFGVDRYLGLEEQLAAQQLVRLPAAEPLVQLLNRATFGIRREDLEEARLLGSRAWIEQQLHPDSIDDGLCDAEIAYMFPVALLPRRLVSAHYSGSKLSAPEPVEDGYGELFNALNAVYQPARSTLLEHSPVGTVTRTPTAIAGDMTMSSPRSAEGALRAMTTYRALWSRRQLKEMMVDFWTNHFNVYTGHSNNVRVHKFLDDRDVIRPHALGNFRDLLIATAKSTSMLIYLDGYKNTRHRPNENYARELMELHTLGVSAMNAADGYNETDVQEVARCFTGWTVDFLTSDFTFDPRAHDYGEKQIMGRTIAGQDVRLDPVRIGPYRTGEEQLPLGGGLSDGLQVINWLVEHPRTAQFLAEKLVRRFIDDEPPAELVADIARAYLGPAGSPVVGDIRGMVRTILNSPWMTDPEVYANTVKFKRPFEYYLSSLRATGSRVARGRGHHLVQRLDALGQIPHNWEPPTGYPDIQAHWLHTNGLFQRWLSGSTLGRGGDGTTFVDVAALAGPITTAGQLVDRLASRVLQRPLLEADRTALSEFAALRLGPAPLQANWQQTAGDLLGLLLGSPYFQVR